MHIYTSSFFKFRNKANFYSFLGASAGTGAPRNTQKIGTQCGCEYGYKNYESFGSLIKTMYQIFEIDDLFVSNGYIIPQHFSKSSIMLPCYLKNCQDTPNGGITRHFSAPRRQVLLISSIFPVFLGNAVT